MKQNTSISDHIINQLFKERNPLTHKGDYGKVLLLCGSIRYTGAAALAAMGALRTGAGLVYLGVPKSIYTIEAIKLLEPVIFPLEDSDGKLSVGASEQIDKYISKMDAILIGPGIGMSEGTFYIVDYVLKNANCPVVLDADGINVISKHKYILRERTAPTILTPHTGEFVRLGGDLSLDRSEAAGKLARDLNCIVLLKGYNTVITDGECYYLNPTGNPGMATGGSGDVLAGIIVSLLGQGVSPLLAAACGAWLHGKAGDICAKDIGQYGMLPQDILNVLPRLLP